MTVSLWEKERIPCAAPLASLFPYRIICDSIWERISRRSWHKLLLPYLFSLIFPFSSISQSLNNTFKPYLSFWYLFLLKKSGPLCYYSSSLWLGWGLSYSSASSPITFSCDLRHISSPISVLCVLLCSLGFYLWILPCALNLPFKGFMILGMSW